MWIRLTQKSWLTGTNYFHFLFKREGKKYCILNVWDLLVYEGKNDERSPEAVTLNEAMDLFIAVLFIPILLPHVSQTLSLNIHHVSQCNLVLASDSYQLMDYYVNPYPFHRFSHFIFF